ncbi:hypothetical protein J7E73_30395 [Paenibacillus albidus]|nr:hypothetical protein [Paenibacillus albidus]
MSEDIRTSVRVYFNINLKDMEQQKEALSRVGFATHETGLYRFWSLAGE